MQSETPKPTLNPAALSLVDAAAVLSRAGTTPVTVAMLQQHVDDGMPLNPDGTINLVTYAAWLVREIANGN